MAITFVAAGTAVWAASGNVTPGLPAGFAQDDIHVCIVTASDNVVPTMPAGWTSKQGVNNGAIERQTIFWRRAVAGDTAPVVTHASGDTVGARIFGFRGCVTSGDPIEAINGGSTGSGIPSASAITATASAITPLSANAAILFALSWTCTDTSNFTTTASYSGTNPVFAEIADNTATAVGINEADFAVAWGLKTDTTTTGARTAVGTNVTASTINWVATLLALTPAAPAGGGLPTNAMLPLTGLQIPGQPAVAPPIGPTYPPDPSTFDVVTPLPISQFVNPISLALGLGKLFPSPQPYVQPASGATYTDSGSGTITLSGTGAESAVFTDSRTGTITLSGTGTESQTHSASRSGTITLSGTGTQSLTAADSRTGTITLSGTGTQSLTTADSGSGTITLSGTGIEQYGRIFNDSGSGTITLSGSGTGSQTTADSRTGTITLSGSGAQSLSASDSRTGTITLSGSGVENFQPPGGSPSINNKLLSDPNVSQHIQTGVR